MSKKAMKLALEALENSIDLVSNEAREAEELYGKYPTRLARIQGLVALEVAHEKAITALREALAEQPAQRKPLTDEQATKAALWDLAVSKGLVTVHSEQLAPGTWSAHLSVASWIEGHDKACDISNEAAHSIKEKNT